MTADSAPLLRRPLEGSGSGARMRGSGRAEA